MPISLPRYVADLLARLRRNGYESYAVGGAVRDLLLGKTPDDYDVATAAPPERVQAIFPHTVPTGLAHGTVTVVTEGYTVEVTAFRTDGAYTDARHPDAVTFGATLSEDLARRDFTVNALAFDGERLIDEHGGLDDLAARTVRAVGDPARRFSEDALRVLRCFRFAAQLDFSVEPATERAALECAGSLSAVSRERIGAELKKLLAGCRPSAIAPLLTRGALAFLSLPAAPLPVCFDRLPPDPLLRLAVLCRVCGAPVSTVLTELRCSRREHDCGERYEKLLCKPIEADRIDLKHRLRYAAPEEIRLAALAAERLNGTPAAPIEKELADILASGEPYRVDMLAVSGDDLTKAGLAGPAVGEALEAMLERVIRAPADNRRETLLGGK